MVLSDELAVQSKVLNLLTMPVYVDNIDTSISTILTMSTMSMSIDIVVWQSETVILVDSVIIFQSEKRHSLR